MFEETRSEKVGTRRPTLSRKEISKIDMNYARRDRQREESAKHALEVRGSGKYIKEGTSDRVMGVVYNTSKYSNSDDQKSYYYGYFVRGSRVLDGLMEQMTPVQIKEKGISEYALGIKEEDFGPLTKRAEYLNGYNEEKEKDITKESSNGRNI